MYNLMFFSRRNYLVSYLSNIGVLALTYYKDLDNQTFSLMTLINVILWGRTCGPRSSGRYRQNV